MALLELEGRSRPSSSRCRLFSEKEHQSSMSTAFIVTVTYQIRLISCCFELNQVFCGRT